MKKVYINPEMEVVLINTMTVLAASDPQTVNEEATSTQGVYDDNASRWFDNGGSEDW